jgi:hypothetical protein
MMRGLLGRVGGLGRRLVTTGPGLATLAGLGTGSVALQYQYGTGSDFFHHSFIAKEGMDPDKIVDFYSTEEFLQILGIFPFAITFVLAGVEWATDVDNVNTVWNSIQISFDITEREVQTADGETVVGFFNKRERFKNVVPFTNILLWDQVQNYGFHRHEDGTIEVHHHGEHFHGPWPVRLLVQLHSKYVIWATEKHINSPIFGSDDVEAVEAQRENIPLYVMNEFVAELRAQQEKAIAETTAKQEAARAANELKSVQDAFATEKQQLVATLKKIKDLELKAAALGGASLEVTSKSRGKLKRQSTVINFSDPGARDAIQSALNDVGHSPAGRKALDGLLRKRSSQAQAA